MNLPTFPLQALAASALGRFGWTPYPDEPLDASCCAVVGLREVSSPTMVRTGDDHDLPMTGRAWIEPGTGRVRRASLQFGGPLDQVEGAFEVTYGAMDGIDVLIPTRLWEWYRRRDQDYLGLPAYVEGQATYSDIRRFTVRTDEMINLPRSTLDVLVYSARNHVWAYHFVFVPCGTPRNSVEPRSGVGCLISIS